MAEDLSNLASLLALGFFLGMRHATDADHIIAIATIVSRQRTLRGSAMIGAAWGVGHTLTILVVGSAIILFGVVIPPQLGLAMELAVGLMLVLLGITTLIGMGQALQGTTSTLFGATGHFHSHDGPFAHLRRAPDDRVDGRRENELTAQLGDEARIGFYNWLRPLVVGIVHGLAGSAAVALLILAVVREPAWAIAYLLLFGVGTIGGMMLITFVLSAPFAFSISLPRLNWRLRTASGLISFAFGMFLIYEIGFADGGLFTGAPVWEPR
jgi:hypothetical protein